MESPQEVEGVAIAPVVTTKQWVASSFENNVTLNKECAEIPSNTSPEKRKWSDKVEETEEEGEILNSEESTNSSSPDDHGEEEDGKENQMDINTGSEEVATQDAPPLKDNSMVTAQPTSSEAEIGAGISQQPEVNLNPGKEQPPAPPVLPTAREEKISSKQKSVRSQEQKNIHAVHAVQFVQKSPDAKVETPFWEYHHLQHSCYYPFYYYHSSGRLTSVLLFWVLTNQQGVVLAQCAQPPAGETIHKNATITSSSYVSQDISHFQIFRGSFLYITWWKSESSRLRGPHAQDLTFEGNSNRGIHSERWKSEEIRLGGPSLSSWWKFEGSRLGGPHTYWIPFERIRVRGSHTVHHWWETEDIRLGGPHIYLRTSEGYRLRGSHAVHHGWASKVIRPGGSRIHWVISEGHRLSRLHIDYHWWESEGTRLGGPLTQGFTSTERSPEGSRVGGVHTVVLEWISRQSGLEDHGIDWYGNPREADLEDHRHRFIQRYTGSLHCYSFILYILLIIQVRYHIIIEMPKNIWYRHAAYSELQIGGNKYMEYTETRSTLEFMEWFRNHLLTHYQCVVLVPRCTQSADNVTINGDGIRIGEIQDNLSHAKSLYMSFYRMREILPTFADRQKAHDRLQSEMCSLGELHLTSAHRLQTHDRLQLGSFYRIGESHPTSAYRRQTDRLQLELILGYFNFYAFHLVISL
ncbi:hypothetical protein K7X08_013447 [Anisodus acutangulus]|uniref:Uncharacterized protein n=1 Tax=Anisodus acutangulus TaxID=402998 RepID=A0A9Q1RHG6_9SOLA|nr:hypothetical protein K7X08_013447 [Anisodus acutangulus]